MAVLLSGWCPGLVLNRPLNQLRLSMEPLDAPVINGAYWVEIEKLAPVVNGAQIFMVKVVNGAK